ncbi:MAG: tryptophan-rich sensory protein [Firmicutes bacterium]|nr:tryptophan-rich sensory protein [Bacillota bacterium]
MLGLNAREWWGLIGFLAVVAAVQGLASWLTFPAVREWYPTLARPTWTPPDWVFGPVWTALYLMMAVAAWWVWRTGGWANARLALSLFALQLALNAAWSGLFFRLRSPAAGLVDILLLWIAIAATLLAFRRHSAVATWLLVPYFVWVSYAAALNFALWRMNR